MNEKRKGNSSRNSFLLSVLIAVLVVNQFVIGSVSAAMGIRSAMQSVLALGTPSAEAKMMIWMPVINDDGKTTSLKEMPTIGEVAAFAGSGDDVADAMAVMMGTGVPEYAPDGVSFDDPVAALASWGSYESLELPKDLSDRYQRLIMIFTCNFCCGGPMNVTKNGRCGCAHAKGARGFFKYMLNNYGDTYTDEQLFGEAYRWQAIWYPAGAVEDYLLVNGLGDVIGHKPHGGVGEDGMHGLGAQ